MTSQTTPSKIERRELIEWIQGRVACTPEVAEAIVLKVLNMYGVTLPVKPRRRRRKFFD